MITQILYIAVFVTRYLDLFWEPPQNNWWNFVLKNFYIWSSIYIIILMLRVYARTRERERAWRLGASALATSLLAAPLVALIFRGARGTTFVEVLWIFSLVLESVCVLPQLLLLRQTTVPTVIDSYYLLTLGSYRAFYILNWILRAAKRQYVDPVPVIFGVVQTAFYLDFAWVYWTRQRVKLRGGGVVDSDDLRKSWLVNRIIGRGSSAVGAEAEEALGPAAPGDGESRARLTVQPSTWGRRGISVSADDTLDEHQATRPKVPAASGSSASTGLLEDPESLGSSGFDDVPPVRR